MKRLFAVITLLVALSVASLQANPITLTQSSNYSYGNGGAFVADIGNGNPFLTFCVEQTVVFSPGTPYQYTVSSVDSQGQPLSRATAFLYSQFIAGTLDGYDYASVNLPVEDGKLQAAIWFFQSQPTLNENGFAGNDGANPFYLLGEGIANPLSPNNGYYNVGIMKVTDGNGNPVQNQLIVTSVPDAGNTLGLVSMALIPMGLMFRRNQLAA